MSKPGDEPPNHTAECILSDEADDARAAEPAELETMSMPILGKDDDLRPHEIARISDVPFFVDVRRALAKLRSLDATDREVGESAQIDVNWVLSKLETEIPAKLRCDPRDIPRELAKLRFPQFVRGMDETQIDALIGRDDFKTAILPTLLAGEIITRHIPRIVWIRERAEAYERREQDIIGTEVIEDATVLRIDISGYVEATSGRDEQTMLDDLDQHFFRPIVEHLKYIPGVKLMEVAGDEAVFYSTDAAEVETFAKSLQRTFRTEPQVFNVEMGIATGRLYSTITPSGRFLMGGEAYEQSEAVQKTLKKLRAGDPDQGRSANPEATTCGIYRYDKSQPMNAEILPHLEGASIESMPEPEHSAIHYSSLWNPNDPDFTKNLRRLFGFMAGTAPAGLLETDRIIYPETSVLFFTFDAPNCAGLAGEAIQEAWAERLEPIERIVSHHNGSMNYVSSGNNGVGRIVIFFGAFKSSPLKQSVRAAECADELTALSGGRHGTIARGRMAQGPLGLSLTGLANVVNLAARIGSEMESEASPHRIAMDNATQEALERDGSLEFTATTEAKPIRGISRAPVERHYCEHINRKDVRRRSFGYQKPLKGILETMQIVARTSGQKKTPESRPENHHIMLHAKPGCDEEEFLEDACEHAAHKGFVVIGKAPPREWYRAYAFATTLLRDTFEGIDHFKIWLDAAAEKKVARSQKPLWQAIFEEACNVPPNLSAVTGRFGIGPSEITDAIAHILAVASESRPLFIVQQKPSQVDEGSQAVMLKLANFKGTKTANLMMISRREETLKDDSPGQTKMLVNLDGLTEEDAFTLVGEEIGLDPSSQISDETKILFRKTLKRAPWPHFLVRELTRWLRAPDSRLLKDDGDLKTQPTLLKLPGSFETYVAQQTSGLKSTTRNVLLAACMLGAGAPTAALDLVAQSVYSVSVPDLKEAIKDLSAPVGTRIQLLEADNEHIAFPHAFLEETVRKINTNDSDRRTKHASIARSLAEKEDMPIPLIIDQAVAGKVPHVAARPTAKAMLTLAEAKPMDAELLASRFLRECWPKVTSELTYLSADDVRALTDIYLSRAKASSRLFQPFKGKSSEAAEGSRGGEVTDTETRLNVAKKFIEHATKDPRFETLKVELLVKFHFIRCEAAYIDKVPGALLESINALDELKASEDPAITAQTRLFIQCHKQRLAYYEMYNALGLGEPERARDLAEDTLHNLQTLAEEAEEGSPLETEAERLQLLIREFRDIMLILAQERLAANDERTRIHELLEAGERFRRKHAPLTPIQSAGLTRLNGISACVLGNFGEGKTKFQEMAAVAEREGQIGFAISIRAARLSLLSDEVRHHLKTKDYDNARRALDEMDEQITELMQMRLTIQNTQNLLLLYLNTIESIVHRLQLPENTADRTKQAALRGRGLAIFELIENECAEHHRRSYKGPIDARRKMLTEDLIA